MKKRMLFYVIGILLVIGVMTYSVYEDRKIKQEYSELPDGEKGLVDRYKTSVAKLQPGDLATDDQGTTYMVEEFGSGALWRMKAKDGTVAYLGTTPGTAIKNRNWHFVHRDSPHYVVTVHTFKLE
jgi:hypothetical protein